MKREQRRRLTRTARARVLLLSVTTSSCTAKWKISSFTPPLPPHFPALWSLSPEQSSQSCSSVQKSKACICLQASADTDHCIKARLGVCQHKALRRSFTVSYGLWSTALVLSASLKHFDIGTKNDMRSYIRGIILISVVCAQLWTIVKSLSLGQRWKRNISALCSL